MTQGNDSAPLRRGFREELDQLRLQVELMGIKVDQNLERMRELLVHDDRDAADAALRADDEIDAITVSLTERCYDLLARENPVAGDLRFVVSVLRIVGEFERIGDLALRIVKLAPERWQLAANESTFDIMLSMADTAIEAYRTALRAWSAQDLSLATGLAQRSRLMDAHYELLSAGLLRIEGPDAVAIATSTLIGGRALERIADHSMIVGARLRYLLTGDPNHLISEVR